MNTTFSTHIRILRMLGSRILPLHSSMPPAVNRICIRGSESAQTKGQSIEWQTPTITGHAIALAVDGDGDKKFREIRNFTSASDCSSWLDTKAGITRT